MRVHLVDGTYELFRQHFGNVRRHGDSGPFAAAAGVVSSTLALVADGATHIGVATDHVIESFRNDLFDGYKTGDGVPVELRSQFEVLETALEAAGFTVWAMVEHEADDALAAAAAVADADERVEQVLIVTPDKDLGQCVSGRRVVQFDRRSREIIDEHAVREKFGVGPASIPDYLGLVGDTADGIPGLAGWGAKSTAKVLARYDHLEHIPDSSAEWDVAGVRGAEKLAVTLRNQRADAVLYRRLATLERDVPVGAVDEWRWRGPRDDFAEVAAEIDAPELAARADRLAERIGGRSDAD